MPKNPQFSLYSSIQMPLQAAKAQLQRPSQKKRKKNCTNTAHKLYVLKLDVRR